MERDGLIVFGCRREPAVAADVCLHTMVVLGLQLLVHAERADAAAIEALLQAEPDVLDLNRAVLSSVQSARTLRLNE